MGELLLFVALRRSLVAAPLLLHQLALADVGCDGVRRDPGNRADAQRCANRVGGAFDAEPRERCQVLIKRPVVPEARFTAADAAMPRLNGIADAAVPLRYRTGVVRDRAAATHLVEAITLARLVVVPGLDEQPCVGIGTAIAGVVYATRVELAGTPLVVEFGPATQHQYVRHHAGHDVGDWWAARHIDHRLADQLVHRRRAGGIGARRLDASIRRATTPGDHRRRILSSFLQDGLRGSTADATVHSIALDRHRTFHQQNVPSGIVLDGVV